MRNQLRERGANNCDIPFGNTKNVDEVLLIEVWRAAEVCNLCRSLKTTQLKMNKSI